MFVMFKPLPVKAELETLVRPAKLVTVVPSTTAVEPIVEPVDGKEITPLLVL